MSADSASVHVLILPFTRCHLVLCIGHCRTVASALTRVACHALDASVLGAVMVIVAKVPLSTRHHSLTTPPALGSTSINDALVLGPQLLVLDPIPTLDGAACLGHTHLTPHTHHDPSTLAVRRKRWGHSELNTEVHRRGTAPCAETTACRVRPLNAIGFHHALRAHGNQHTAHAKGGGVSCSLIRLHLVFPHHGIDHPPRVVVNQGWCALTLVIIHT